MTQLLWREQATKAKGKKPAIHLSKIKETFLHTSKEFCIPDPPLEKGKGPEIESTSIELHSDWKASTSSTVCKENEPASNIKYFLQSYSKLIQDENAHLEVQRLIDYYNPTNTSTTAERAVDQIKRYIHTGRDM